MSLIKKSYQIVAEELLKMIENGLLRPGDRIPTIDALAEQYGVGRSTIREALSQLKARGLVEARQGEGTFVKSTAAQALNTMPTLVASTAAELKHLLQVRKLIETGCAELAALEHTADDLSLLQGIIEKMQLSIGNEEMSRIYDIQFHMKIAAATHNPYLTKMMESISDAMNQTIRDSRNLWLYSRESAPEQLFREHQDIFLAIAERNPQKAKERMSEHLRRVEESLEVQAKI